MLVVLDAAVLLASESGLIHLDEPLRELGVSAGVLSGEYVVGDGAVDGSNGFDVCSLMRNQPERLLDREGVQGRDVVAEIGGEEEAVQLHELRHGVGEDGLGAPIEEAREARLQEELVPRLLRVVVRRGERDVAVADAPVEPRHDAVRVPEQVRVLWPNHSPLIPELPRLVANETCHLW